MGQKSGNSILQIINFMLASVKHEVKHDCKIQQNA